MFAAHGAIAIAIELKPNCGPFRRTVRASFLEPVRDMLRSGHRPEDIVSAAISAGLDLDLDCAALGMKAAVVTGRTDLRASGGGLTLRDDLVRALGTAARSRADEGALRWREDLLAAAVHTAGLPAWAGAALRSTVNR